MTRREFLFLPAVLSKNTIERRVEELEAAVTLQSALFVASTFRTDNLEARVAMVEHGRRQTFPEPKGAL